MKLSIIIVNWNVKRLLRDCLMSLQAQLDDTSEIIVVDSASHDDSPQMVRTEFPSVQLIESSTNLGYAKGNNLGVRHARGEYLLLLNPDTVVKPHTLTTLTHHLDSQPTVGVVGPQLLWADGSIQSSRRRLPTVGTLFWESTLLHQWWPHNPHARRYHLADIPPDSAQTVDWLVGAALLIRRTTWTQVGGFDEDFFMYFEETDWCKRCQDAGWAIHYLPTAQIVHYEGKSSEQVAAARTIRFQRSKLRYTRKHFGRGWAVSLRLFLWLTFSYQLLSEGGKWLLRHRPALRRERVQAYAEVLRRI